MDDDIFYVTGTKADPHRSYELEVREDRRVKLITQL